MKGPIETSDVIYGKKYVAEDGTQFSSENMCRDYEDGIARIKASFEVENLPQFCSNYPYYPGHEDDPEWRWLYLGSEEDLENVKAALFCRDCTARLYEIATFPCWALAIVGDGGYGQIVTFEEFVSTQDKFVASLIAVMDRFVPKEVN